jgi:hypothetical protein
LNHNIKCFSFFSIFSISNKSMSISTLFNELSLVMVALRLLEATCWFRSQNIKYPLLCKSNLMFGHNSVYWKEFRYSQSEDELEALVYSAP